MKMQRYLWLCAALALWGCPPSVQEICGNNAVEPPETCDDGNKISGDGCSSVCQTEGAANCGNAQVDVGEQCDGNNLNGQSCASLGQGSGTLGCLANCQLDLSLCQAGDVCGDGAITGNELCDGALLGGADCTTQGFDAGNLACSATCDGFDTSGCTIAGGNCGDGNIDAGEQCDNGGTNSNTGACTLACKNAKCGDNFIETGVETCDDGNTTNGDGCSSVCIIEPPPPTCGNGALNAGETCDGNNLNGQSCTTIGGGFTGGSLACNANCLAFVTTGCTGGATDVCTPPIAGSVGANNSSTSGKPSFADGSCQDPDGGDVAFSFTPATTSITITLASATDQGIFVLDSCSAAGNEIDCQDVEVGGTDEVLPLSGLTVGVPIFIFVGAFDPGDEGPFTLTIAAAAGASCGNGTIDAGETCDDNNNITTDACPSGPTGTCLTAKCGDGFVRSGTEQCDDGNTASGDGCSATCQNEAAVCGNGVIQTGEQCDDGNTTNGDGCSSTCQTEAGAGTLLFSEYVEGSAFNKAVEIKNTFSTSFDLAANTCKLELFSNGATNASTSTNLTGTIAAGDVIVFCNASQTTIGAACDQNAAAVNFSGDDAIRLSCGATVFDIIGQIGFQPASGEWADANQALNSTKDNTIRRKCSVTTGDTNGANDFNLDLPAAWVGFATDTFAGLGDPACAP